MSLLPHWNVVFGRKLDLTLDHGHSFSGFRIKHLITFKMRAVLCIRGEPFGHRIIQLYAMCTDQPAVTPSALVSMCGILMCVHLCVQVQVPHACVCTCVKHD